MVLDQALTMAQLIAVIHRHQRTVKIAALTGR